eukprot:gene10814-14515_t
MEGSVCSEVGCRNCDFLPFYCPLCSGSYCLDHRSRFVHTCNNTDGLIYDDNNVKGKSSGIRVKDIYTAVKNRFESVGSIGSQNEHYKIRSTPTVADMKTPSIGNNTQKTLSKLNNVSTQSNNSKERSISQKTKAILLKNKSIGDNGIDPMDRFYLSIRFFDSYSTAQSYLFAQERHDSKLVEAIDTSNPVHFYYFNKQNTLGTVVQHICRLYPQFAFRSASKPEHLTLSLISSDTPDWRDWNRNVSISLLFADFEEVFAFPMPIVEVVANQTIMDNILREKLNVEENKMEVDVNEPVNSKPYEYVKGESAWYHSSNLTQHIAVRIVGVHHDDFPNIYYTVQPITPNANLFTEKQTDHTHLIPFTKECSIGTSDSNQQTEDDNIDPNSAINIIVIHGKQEYRNIRVSLDFTVLELKNKLYKLTKVLPQDQKIICRGLTLKDSNQKLRNTKLSDGVKITLVGNITV